MSRGYAFIPFKAAALAALGLTIALSAPAVAQEGAARHRHHHRAAEYAPAQPGDIIVRTGRLYYYPEYHGQDPYTSFLAGPHYYADTALDTDPGLVHPFGHFGEAVLPSRFDPPGQTAPLFTFW